MKGAEFLDNDVLDYSADGLSNIVDDGGVFVEVSEFFYHEIHDLQSIRVDFVFNSGR